MSVVDKARTALARQGAASAAKQAAEAAEAELAAQRQAAEVAEREAKRAERERAAEQRRTETAAAAAIQRLTEAVQEAEGQAARLAAEAVPTAEVRTYARMWVRGQLAPIDAGEDAGPAELRLTRRDPAAEIVLTTWEHVRRSLGWIPTELGYEHELARAVDALECRCWRSFVYRVSQLAGEVD